MSLSAESGRSIQVYLAQPRGFCAGVVRAIEIVERALEKYGPPVYVRHEIVHNKHVVESLKNKGAIFVEDLSEVPPLAVTVFSAHGVARSVEEEAAERGLPVLNATCPLVTKVHNQGKRYISRGRTVILIGHAGHPEVEGTMGQVPGPVLLVQSVEEVKALTLPEDTPVAYITQTTLSVDDTREIIVALQAKFTEIQGPDIRDICYATQNRQSAVRELSKLVDVILVVGAANSSNSNRLREIGTESGVESYLIADGSELNPDWLRNARAVGITAGASAPEVLVDDVIAALRRIGPVTVSVLPGREENIEFRSARRTCGGLSGELFRTDKSRKKPVMAIPFLKELRIGGYLIKQKLLGRKRYPLVLMLEPLFRCNLACAGCGKIDYPDAILNRRMTVQECLDAADECGAPMVAIPGGEPLIHKDIGEIVKGLVARKKFVSLCTNALLLEKKLHLFEPSPYLFFSVHLDGLRDHHDKAVSQQGVFDKAVSAIKAAKAKGFTVNVNATIFDGHPAEEIAKYLDFCTELGVGVSMSPGYAYERAPDQEHFLNRTKTKTLFRDVFAMGKGKKWNFMHSGLFLDFLAGNQNFECTPWGMPARNIFGWQKPCYLLGEGYTKTFKELMETTDWETYGTGKYEKCADCMAHCGYEPTAATASLNNPIKAMWVAMRGIRTTGPMAPEIDLSNQRPAQYIFSEQVQKKLSDIRRDEALAAQQKASTAA
jgi:(E)-4-hydroxy-3-methyl-but-2-enyl pyrophosphate reductase